MAIAEAAKSRMKAGSRKSTSGLGRDGDEDDPRDKWAQDGKADGGDRSESDTKAAGEGCQQRGEQKRDGQSGGFDVLRSVMESRWKRCFENLMLRAVVIGNWRCL